MRKLRHATWLAAVVLILTACGGEEPTTPGGPVVVEMQTSIDEGHIMSRMADKFAQLVDEYSDGKIRVEVRYGDPYGDLYTTSEQVARGQREMTGGLFYPELDQRFGIALMGGLVTNWDEAKELYGPGAPMTELLNQIGREAGVVALATTPTGFGGTIFRGDAPSDLPTTQAFTVRVPPYEGMDALFKSLGYNTVVTDFGEVYTALQTGTIDGKGATPPQEAAETFLDISDVYLVDRTYFESLWSMLVSTDWLAAQTEEHQEILWRAGEDAAEWAWDEARKLDDGFLKEIEDAGVEVRTLSDEKYAELAELSRDVEWPVIEAQVGAEVMDQVRAMAQ